MVAGRLFSTIVSHYQQVKDCEYNHQQLEIAHRQNLLLRLFRRIGRQPLPISYYEYERSNRPPFHGSAIFIITHALQLIKSLALILVLLGLDTCHKRHGFYRCYNRHNHYNLYRLATDSTKLTSLTMLTNPPHSPCSPSLQNADNFQMKVPKQCVLVRVVRDVREVREVSVACAVRNVRNAQDIPAIQEGLYPHSRLKHISNQ